MVAVEDGWGVRDEAEPRSAQVAGVSATGDNNKVRMCVCRNRLRLALTGREVTLVVQEKEAGFKVDGKIRRDTKFPVGVMDVLTVVKTNEHYRMLYDVKGRFTLLKIKENESKLKLLRVRHKHIGPNKIPYIVTHDARTIRFPHPDINEGDTIQYDLEKGQIVSWVKSEVGCLAYIIGGNNIGRVGTLQSFEKHQGSFDIVHIKDSNGKNFSTRKSNLFVIGDKKPLLTLPEDQGLYLNILEEQARREERKAHHK